MEGTERPRYAYSKQTCTGNMNPGSIITEPLGSILQRTPFWEMNSFSCEQGEI